MFIMSSEMSALCDDALHVECVIFVAQSNVGIDIERDGARRHLHFLRLVGQISAGVLVDDFVAGRRTAGKVVLVLARRAGRVAGDVERAWTRRRAALRT